jgi:hypothetical protein
MLLRAFIPHAWWLPERRAWMRQAMQALHPLRPIVVPDNDRQGLWPTVQRAWRLGVMSGATHVLVMQDDVAVQPGCLANLRGILAARPDACISLFSPRATVRKAVLSGVAWLETADGCWGQALILPRAWVSEWLAWCQCTIRLDYPHDDARLAMWLMTTGRSCFITCPSLVEHAGADASTVGHGGSAAWPTRAASLLQPDVAVDWSNLRALRSTSAATQRYFTQHWAADIALDQTQLAPWLAGRRNQHMSAGRRFRPAGIE